MAEEMTLLEKVEKSIDGIRPALQRDGGDVELVGIEDGIVKVKMAGACHGCPMAAMTLQMGIERKVKQDVPEIKAVQAVSGLPE